jgi:uncharacterized protein
MAVVRPDYDTAPRGRRDASRHREKVRDALRRNLPDVIADEAIITRRESRIVRVPIRGVRSYQFIHGRAGAAGGGLGTGDGKPGKVLGRRPKPGQGPPGRPGGEPGVDYLETEIEIEELIRMMLEDLGLPNLRDREVREIAVAQGWTFDSVERTGIRPRLDKKRTVKEAIKRTEVVVAALMEESGRTEDDCRAAFALAQGDGVAALRLLASGAPLVLPAGDGPPAPLLESADLRYRTLAQDTERHSNAVVIAMMDVSGSMDRIKKYFARSFFFWMLSFLRTIYRSVEIRFIAHTTEARLVDEHEFFHKGESGGTNCFSAYDLACALVDAEYPPSRWNIYPFHFSDGEDWEPERTVRSLESLLERGPAAFGYGEIQTDYSSSVLMQTFARDLGMTEGMRKGLRYYESTWKEAPVLGVVLRAKEDIYPALQVFLSREQGARP